MFRRRCVPLQSRQRGLERVDDREVASQIFKRPLPILLNALGLRDLSRQPVHLGSIHWIGVSTRIRRSGAAQLLDVDTALARCAAQLAQFRIGIGIVVRQALQRSQLHVPWP